MSPHRVPFAVYKKNLKRAEVLDLIAHGYSPRQVARRLNCGVSGCRKLILRLKKDGLLTHTTLLTTKGGDTIKQYTVGCDYVPSLHVPETIRLHDLIIKCKVDDPNWERKREAITHLNLKDIHSWETKGGKQTWFKYDLETSVRLTSKSVLIKLPDVYGSTPFMVKEEALRIFYKVRAPLEQLLNMRLKKRADFNFCVVSSQHLAFIYDKIAKFFLKEGLNLTIYDNHGKKLWIVDNSQGLGELEAIHKAKAEDVGEEYKRFLTDISTHPWENLSSITKKVENTLAKLDSFQKALDQQARAQAQMTDVLIQLHSNRDLEVSSVWT